jgi:hypothetical protein
MAEPSGLRLTQTLRTVLAFFLIVSLTNNFYALAEPRPGHDGDTAAAPVLCWAALAFSTICLVHSHVVQRRQHEAGPHATAVGAARREKRAVVAHGCDDDDDDDDDSSGSGADRRTEGLVRRIACLVVDAALATLLLVFLVRAGCVVERRGRRVLPSHMPSRGRSVWLTVAVFEYALAFVQACEVVSICWSRWYGQRRGRISLA